MSGLTSLPEAVLKLVMQHVPLRDRLSRCCLVNKKLHAAALAATQQLELASATLLMPSAHSVPLTSLERAQSILQWLDLYGQHLTCLKMQGVPQSLLQLPCPNLQELDLSIGCSVHLGPTAFGQPGVIQGVPKLTRLELSCSFIDVQEGAVLESLSSLVDLQFLQVQPLRFPFGTYQLGGLSSGTIPRLQRLTYLYVSGLSVENVVQLVALSSLKELHLRANSDQAVGPSSVPGMAFPASLTKLMLLSPVEAGILSVVPTGLLHLSMPDVVEGPAVGPGSFLSGLGRLHHLNVLFVDGGDGLKWPPPGPAYSALTVSSSLDSLSIYGNQLPAAVWPFVFPAARTLPQLTYLYINNKQAGTGVDPDLPQALGAAELASIISCCPNLCHIALPLQHGPHVSELQRLTALTTVVAEYGSDCMSDLETIEQSLLGLAALTCLGYLVMYAHRRDVSVGSLLPLTSLTALTMLTLDCWPASEKDSETASEEEDSEGSDLVEPEVTLKQVGSEPYVWLQLLECCTAEDPDCQPTALRSLAQQLAEQRALTAQQQQQLAAQQQQITDQRDQISRQQQQLSAQQQVAADQGAQIAGLQGSCRRCSHSCRICFSGSSDECAHDAVFSGSARGRPKTHSSSIPVVAAAKASGDHPHSGHHHHHHSTTAVQYAWHQWCLVNAAKVDLVVIMLSLLQCPKHCMSLSASAARRRAVQPWWVQENMRCRCTQLCAAAQGVVVAVSVSAPSLMHGTGVQVIVLRAIVHVCGTCDWTHGKVPCPKGCAGCLAALNGWLQDCQ